MAVGGSGLLKRHNSTLYWLENDGVTYGPLLNNLLECLAAVGGDAYIGMIWDHGESAGGETVPDLTDWYGNIFDAVKAVAPTMKFFISMHGRRSDSAAGDAEMAKKFDAYFALAAERTDTYVLPNKSVLPMYDETGAVDGVHISDAAHIENMKWAVRKIAHVDGQSVTGPVDGPSIINSVRSGAVITHTLSLPSGITDFTPTTGIEGFVAKLAGVAQTNLSVVRTNATTITQTLTADPGASVSVEYCYDSVYGATRTNLVRGNDSNTMPLQKYKATIA